MEFGLGETWLLSSFFGSCFSVVKTDTEKVEQLRRHDQTALQIKFIRAHQKNAAVRCREKMKTR